MIPNKPFCDNFVLDSYFGDQGVLCGAELVVAPDGEIYCTHCDLAALTERFGTADPPTLISMEKE